MKKECDTLIIFKKKLNFIVKLKLYSMYKVYAKI